MSTYYHENDYHDEQGGAKDKKKNPKPMKYKKKKHNPGNHKMKKGY